MIPVHALLGNALLFQLCVWVKTRLIMETDIYEQNQSPLVYIALILFLNLLYLCWCLTHVSHLPAQACRDFLDLAESHSRRWQRVLQHEREQRTHLEETIEQLAKQHNSLERAWREAPTHAVSTPDTPITDTGETLEPVIIQNGWAQLWDMTCVDNMMTAVVVLAVCLLVQEWVKGPGKRKRVMKMRIQSFLMPWRTHLPL